MHKITLLMAAIAMGAPAAAMAASTTTSTSLSQTSNGIALSATTAGGAAQATASGPYSQTASFGTASTLQATISPSGKFSASGGTLTASSINGQTTAQSFGWTYP